MRALADAVGLVRSYAVTIPLIYFATIFWGSVSLLFSLLDSTGWRQHACARAWARTVLAISGARVHVSGHEHLEAGRTYVFVANHTSYMDIPVVFAALPGHFRVLAKASLFYIPFLGWHLGRSGSMPIPTRRGSPGRAASSFLAAARLVQRGTTVFVFPEGGRSPDGRPGEFRPGAFLLAIRAGVPVAPVTIRGTRGVLGYDRWHIRPGRVEFILHPPIATAGMTADSAARLTEQVRATIAGALDEPR